MMNAELVKAGQSKIMIPNVFRDDYIGALRRLTRKSEPDPYIGMMSRAHEFSEKVYGENRNEMEDYACATPFLKIRKKKYCKLFRDKPSVPYPFVKVNPTKAPLIPLVLHGRSSHPESLL